MCGICGIFEPEATAEPDRKLLDRATDLMTHRGPDGRGTWLEPGIGIGHRRLAVIDPEGSPQPMISGDGRYVISYNGEVYNFAELRRELEAGGFVFRTRGDTEVVLEALAKWGTFALNRFSGMFALALWDRLERSLLIARDRLGVKPLFYSEVGGILIFASEFKPLLIYPWISRAPDPFGINAYLFNYQVSFDGQTIFKDIKSLEAGHFLFCNREGSNIHRYWELKPIPSSRKKVEWPNDRMGEAAHELADLMKKAVQSHMVADVPIGAFLSGGIDSSVIISHMSELCGENVKAYSIGFEDEGFSEFEYSVPLVRELGLHHQLLKSEHADYFPLMEELISHRMAPLSTPNEVPLWALSKHLAKDIKVVLSGEGADELLGGYAPLLRSPHDYLAAKILRENPGGLPADVRRTIRAGVRRQYGRTGFSNLLEHFLMVYAWLNENDRSDVLSQEFFNEDIEQRIKRVWQDRFDRVEGLSAYDTYIYILETVHLQGLLMRLDADTMAASVEGRVPYCDNRLVDFVWSLPFEYKLRWKSIEHRRMSLGRNSLEIAEKLDVSKYLLKRAYRKRLPQKIIDREKKAFPVPLEVLLKNDYKNQALNRIIGNPKLKTYLNLDNMDDWVKKTIATGSGAMKVWMLINLAIWLEKIEDGI